MRGRVCTSVPHELAGPFKAGVTDVATCMPPTGWAGRTAWRAVDLRCCVLVRCFSCPQKEAEERAAAEARAAEAARAAARAARLAALPPEPPAEQQQGAAVVLCAFRLPSGARVSRRFLADAPLAALFQFVDLQDGVLDGLRYNLITQFPRRTLQRPAEEEEEEGGMDAEGAGGRGPTLRSLGLGQGGQELFLLEPLADDDDE